MPWEISCNTQHVVSCHGEQVAWPATLSKGGWGAMPWGQLELSSISEFDAKEWQLFLLQCNAKGKGPGELAFHSACGSCPPWICTTKCKPLSIASHALALVLLSAPYTHPYGNTLLSQSASCPQPMVSHFSAVSWLHHGHFSGPESKLSSSY